MEKIKKKAKGKFTTVEETSIDLFGGSPLLINSPGRINLIGEHTDYNDGFVMPAAIDKGIQFALSKREGDRSKVFSLKYNELLTIDHNNPERVSSPMWVNYLLGVLHKVKERGMTIGAFNCVFDGDLPTGSGLSSSAAMECGFLFGINELFQLNIPKEEMILMAQWAEHNYVGVRCGIMDQFASMMGKKDHVMLLDCQSLVHEYFPINLDGYKILLCDTGVHHSLASSEYNTRRSECEQGVAILKEKYPKVRSLRDVTAAIIEEHKDLLPGKVYDRCLYVTQEIERVVKASDDLRNDRIHSFGQKMYDTHHGLSKLYEVSCPELDFLVAQARENESVIGSRMMGGGFGGCTINIIEEKAIDEFIRMTSKAYQLKFGIELKTHLVTIDNGTTLSDKK